MDSDYCENSWFGRPTKPPTTRFTQARRAGARRQGSLNQLRITCSFVAGGLTFWYRPQRQFLVAAPAYSVLELLLCTGKGVHPSWMKGPRSFL